LHCLLLFALAAAAQNHSPSTEQGDARELGAVFTLQAGDVIAKALEVIRLLLQGAAGLIDPLLGGVLGLVGELAEIFNRIILLRILDREHGDELSLHLRASWRMAAESEYYAHDYGAHLHHLACAPPDLALHANSPTTINTKKLNCGFEN
jgi:hypothetical protein